MTRDEALAESRRTDGWCSKAKAAWLYDAAASIASREPTAMAAEVGVFAGKSLIPIAAGLGRYGLTFGIDPWCNAAAIAGDHKDFDVEYWSNANLEKRERSVRELIQRCGLNCLIFKETSESASAAFRDGSLAMVHIDGNHDAAHALADFQRWLPKLCTGGIFVVDDTGNPSWPGVDASIWWLDERCERIHIGDNFTAWQRL